MDNLVVTSCLAANTHAAGRAVADYIGQRLGIHTEFVVDIDWQERVRLLDSGQIHLGWICGLLYVTNADGLVPQLALLAAPVMQEARYRSQPVYYSDIVVRSDSPFHSFEDLQGVRWVYNEPGSYSGYYIVCHRLAKREASLDYFGSVLESGAHINSLQMLRDGYADVAVLDSTLLDYEIMRQPSLAQELRVIETLGPSPVPPWVINRQLPRDLRHQLCELLLAMHLDPEGQTALATGDVSRFVAVTDSDYQLIRDVAHSARLVAVSA